MRVFVDQNIYHGNKRHFTAVEDGMEFLTPEEFLKK